jgi:hypothetical protein
MQVLKMSSGIRIKCKKGFGQFLITEKPYAIINDVETKELGWNKEFFIPLQPDLPYKITIQFPYMSRPTGMVSFTTQLRPDEAQSYEYKTPFVATSEGSIERKS